ncbi:MAG TPA: DUF1684 domain-containing protein [Candidatus Limnocylindria bacterium]|nr:DUF1684 domain-containing protein [Candidatus Limnocylindria bacterium]
MTHEAAVWADRERRLEWLRRPEGWLTLVGLTWLHDGDNRVGAGSEADVVLPATDLPALAGTVVVRGGDASFVPALEAGVTHDGEPLAGALALVDDLDGEPTRLALGTLRFHLIRRGDRLGIRVRDRAAPALAAFRGIEYFPIDASWRITARFERTPGRTISVPDVTGEVLDEPSPGSVVFERDGHEQRLDALQDTDDGALFLVFGDATNGRETYGGGRFLYTDAPSADGSVVADFNLAYNPPCVFSPFATCPLPWAQNRLAVRIEAGERAYGLDLSP